MNIVIIPTDCAVNSLHLEFISEFPHLNLGKADKPANHLGPLAAQHLYASERE